MLSPTERFSSRVENYLRHRPSYPAALLDWLKNQAGITSDSRLVDLGSGTGIFSRLLAQRGWKVWGVEPNAEMRGAAEQLLSDLPSFHSSTGTAEQTGLPSQFFDGITAAQAFHWFDQKAVASEWCRILKPDGWVAVIWNRRLTEETNFLLRYEQLLRMFCPDYALLEHRRVTEQDVHRLLGHPPIKADFPNTQQFDLAGLSGRLLSCSYAPEAGSPGHAPMLAELREIFDSCQRDGRVEVIYTTECYFGRFVEKS